MRKRGYGMQYVNECPHRDKREGCVCACVRACVCVPNTKHLPRGKEHMNSEKGSTQ